MSSANELCSAFHEIKRLNQNPIFALLFYLKSTRNRRQYSLSLYSYDKPIITHQYFILFIRIYFVRYESEYITLENIFSQVEQLFQELNVVSLFFDGELLEHKIILSL